jgi:hypothetical protein
LYFMTDVTRLLSALEKGDPHAAEQLLPLVYEELRKLAAQTAGLASAKYGSILRAFNPYQIGNTALRASVKLTGAGSAESRTAAQDPFPCCAVGV